MNEAQRFDKSVLHVFCQTWEITVIMGQAFGQVSGEDETVREAVVGGTTHSCGRGS